MSRINNNRRLYIFVRQHLPEKTKKLTGKIKARIKKVIYAGYYERFTVDDRIILLEPRMGPVINGNLYYILEHLVHTPEYKAYKIYISIDNGTITENAAFLMRHGIEVATNNGVNLTSHCALVSRQSREYLKILATAKYVLCDNAINSMYCKKKNQIYICTWHGTPLKTLGKSIKKGEMGISNAVRSFLMADYILCPNQLTYQGLVKDYMIENLTDVDILWSGYPRNTVFFDIERQKDISSAFRHPGEKIYAYLPTYRGAHKDQGTQYVLTTEQKMEEHLQKLDALLKDDEILYVHSHHVTAHAGLGNTGTYRHIKPFPIDVEVYELLSIADCLITDYSSVFFDYAVTGKKIVLFPFDEKEYLEDRGLYLKLEKLPFPRCYDVGSLIRELREPKNYDDGSFLESYCKYDSFEATRQFCDAVFQDKKDELLITKTKTNDKDNVIIYDGDLALNGITTSLHTLLTSINTDKRNYWIAFNEKGRKAEYVRNIIPESVNMLPENNGIDLPLKNYIAKILFQNRLLPTKQYMAINHEQLQKEWNRHFGDAQFDVFIHFKGYGNMSILRGTIFKGKKVIFVHNNMLGEIKTKHNQRRDVLEYAYANYDKVALVSEDLVNPTSTLVDNTDKLTIVHNLLDVNIIKDKASLPIALDNETRCWPARDKFYKIMETEDPIFITIGRFSPEKGHLRLLRAFAKLTVENSDCRLIILGGYAKGKMWEKTIEEIERLHLEDKVALLLGVSNPYPILKKCDYFILSSFYEGMPYTLREADVLGKPVVATDIIGTGWLPEQNKVDNSEEGILHGMQKLLRGEITATGINYEEMNEDAIQEFEALFL